MGQTLNSTGWVVLSYVEGGGTGVGSLLVLQIKHDPFSSSEAVKPDGRVKNARWRVMNDSVVDAKGLTTKWGVDYPNLVRPQTKPRTPVQECLGSEVLALSVERNGGTVIDLNRIGTTIWTHHSIYLHAGTWVCFNNEHVGSHWPEIGYPRRSRYQLYEG